ncbi:MAG: hypothetical protein JXA13_16890 [Anaerolineales bacterium]|nr:hypothetical protein [Anaerolineales bacterium]
MPNTGSLPQCRLAIGMLGIVYSVYRRQAGWVRVEARCIDREVQECLGDPDSVDA